MSFIRTALISTISRLFTGQPGQRSLIIYLTLVCAIYLVWLGGLKLTAGELKSSMIWLSGSAIFNNMINESSVNVVNLAAMIVQITTGVLLLISLTYQRWLTLASSLAIAIFSFNFLYLFTNPVWMDELGGFPIIGSGQGIIKYLAMIGVAMYLLACSLSAQNRRLANIIKPASIWLCWAGILLVMGWIGAMKFFSFEAEGIVRLMQSNGLFSWTYRLWDVQGASNFIGMTELTFALGILCAPWSKTIGRLGVIGIALTTLGTLSFMVSLPGWRSLGEFYLLNGSGIFMLKDQLLLAAAVILWCEFPMLATQDSAQDSTDATKDATKRFNSTAQQ